MCKFCGRVNCPLTNKAACPMYQLWVRAEAVTLEAQQTIKDCETMLQQQQG